MPSAQLKALAIGGVVLVVIGLLGLVAAYEQVEEGHQGVTTEWGAVTGETLQPGAHWKIPVMQNVRNVEVRPRVYNDTVDVTTLNGTTFTVQYVIRYRVADGRATEFVQEWNTLAQAENRLIDPTVDDRIRREGSNIPSAVIFTKEGRDRLSSAATDILTEEFQGEALVLESVQIVDVGVPESYQQALNEKEIAKQQVQQEEYNVQAEEQRKRQSIIQAEAEAESVRVRAEAYEDHPVILQAEYMDAIGEGSVFVVPADGSTPVILDGETVQSAQSESGAGTGRNTSSLAPPSEPAAQQAGATGG